jgi:iron(III) transport system permease protein
MPLIALAVISLGSSPDSFVHLAKTILGQALITTLILLIGTGLVTALVGVSTAWLITMCRFPGRGLLELALVLPLAVPTYIVAYAYVELLDFTGPAQSAVRAIFGFKSGREYWFPEIRSLPGAIFVMSAVLYPYVYMTARILFLMQSSSALEVSRTLGCGPWRLFTHVALPLARPALAVGVSLVLMECLNDIGAVEFFGVRTMTFAIYDTWLNRGNLAGAAQLALILTFFVLVLIAAERSARGRQSYHTAGRRQQPPTPFRLSGWRAWTAALACLLPVLFGFVFPALLLADYASRRLEQFTSPAVLSAGANSLSIAMITACLAVIVAFVLVYAARLSRSRTVGALGRMASVGYAIPGTVLAIGILIPLAAIDNFVDGAMRQWFGISTGLLLAGSGIAIIYACTVRFLAVSFGSVDAAMAKITDHLDMAARTLGRKPHQMLFTIHLPLLRGALASAWLLVFVDTMKELSATVLLRPFDFETLATFVYAQASRGVFEDAAAPALVIVAIGIVPLVILLRTGQSDNDDQTFKSSRSR